MLQKRLRTAYQFNFKLWKSVLDWTVITYIAIPGLIIGFFLMRDFLLHTTVLELAPQVFLTLLFVLSFFICKSSLRLFLYEADLLFYKQLTHKIRSLKLTAYAYSFGLYNLFLLAGLIASSFFIELDVLKLLILFNTVSTFHLICNYLVQRWTIRLPLLAAVHAVLTLSFLFTPTWGYITGLIIGQFILLKIMLSNRYWATEIKWEYEAFYKWMKLLYQLSMEMRYYLPIKVSQPFIVLGKNKVFSKYRLDNLVYKTLLRKFQYISLSVRLIALCIGLLLILPLWAKILVVIFTIVGLYTALHAILTEIQQAPFFQLLHVTGDEWIHTKLRLQKRLLYPIIVTISLLCFILSL